MSAAEQTAGSQRETSELETIVAEIRDAFELRHRARETALAASRRVVQHSANAIRAMHRHEDARAEEWLGRAREQSRAAQDALAEFPEIYHAGFLHDALKEYAEASLALAMVSGAPVPGPAEIGVEAPAYLNGLAEAVGELRRYILDAMRHGDLARSEQLLALMDEVYSLLVTIDYPDAITRGLRRNTDMVRGVTERTRADLTVAEMQARVAGEMAALRARLDEERAARSGDA